MVSTPMLAEFFLLDFEAVNISGNAWLEFNQPVSGERSALDDISGTTPKSIFSVPKRLEDAFRSSLQDFFVELSSTS